MTVIMIAGSCNDAETIAGIFGVNNSLHRSLHLGEQVLQLTRSVCLPLGVGLVSGQEVYTNLRVSKKLFYTALNSQAKTYLGRTDAVIIFSVSPAVRQPSPSPPRHPIVRMCAGRCAIAR